MPTGILVESVSGQRLTSQTRQVTGYGQGRVCEESECGTILSMYNPLSKCSIHGDSTEIRVRGSAR